MAQGIQHEPTEQSRAQVLALIGFGITEDKISEYFGISSRTLRKHYKKEIANGVTNANLQVGGALFRNALSGNVAAQIFWMKCRAGWRESIRVETTGPNGGPIETINSQMTPQQAAAAYAATLAGDQG